MTFIVVNYYFLIHLKWSLVRFWSISIPISYPYRPSSSHFNFSIRHIIQLTFVNFGHTSTSDTVVQRNFVPAILTFDASNNERTYSPQLTVIVRSSRKIPSTICLALISEWSTRALNVPLRILIILGLLIGAQSFFLPGFCFPCLRCAILVTIQSCIGQATPKSKSIHVIISCGINIYLNWGRLIKL